MDKRQKVYERLKELGISYEVTEHPAVYTIEELEQALLARRGGGEGC